MRQLLGSEPLQAILGAICKKEDYDKYYIGMIDSMDPVAILQGEQEKEKEKEQGGSTTEGETPLRQRAEEILTSLRQRRQQWRQQRQQPRTTRNDDNDSSRRRIETPRRQGREILQEM